MKLFYMSEFVKLGDSAEICILFGIAKTHPSGGILIAGVSNGTGLDSFIHKPSGRNISKRDMRLSFERKINLTP